MWLRLCIGAAALLVASALNSIAYVLPWTLLVLGTDLVAGALLGAVLPTREGRRQALVLLLLGAGAAGTAMSFAGPGAQPLLLVPALHAGERFGRRTVLWLCLVGAISAAGVSLLRQQLELQLSAEIAGWTGLGIVMGLLGAVAAQGSRSAQDDESHLATEAAVLLRRLHALADSLDTGFDAPASAEMALEQLALRMHSKRSAVLVAFGCDPAVPLAIRGVDRTPWPAPTRPDSVLAPAWHDGQPLLRIWSCDGIDRSVIAVPLRSSDGSRMGAIVADRRANTPFSSADLAAALEIAAVNAPNIDLSVVFAGLRERAGLEERERLAREMHDGIAQEVVALGFSLDALRRVARREHSPLAEGLDALRADLSRTLADLRVHIADLRIAVRPDTGVGALISGRLQSFGAGSRVATRMDLDETGFRLPAHTEVLIYRLFLRVLADVRQAADATIVSVGLNVAAPRAEFVMTHDGASSLRQSDFLDHPLVALGGEITLVRNATAGVTLRLRIRNRPAAPSAELVHERIPSQREHQRRSGR